MVAYGSFLRVFVVIGLLAAGFDAPARDTVQYNVKGSIFTCKDPNGKTITSDRPIDACASLPMRELRQDGALRRDIAPPLTRAQRRMEAEKRARQRADDMIRRQEQTRDRALLQAFPTMNELNESRARQIAEIQVQIDKTYVRMVDLHKELQAAQAASRAYPPGLAPEPVKQKIAKIAGAILTEDSLVKAHLQEQEQIRNRFSADADRLRVLLERQAEADRLAG